MVYAGNTVSHMMTGKAVLRAVRGHLLVDAAINTILVADSYNVPVPTKDTLDEPLDQDEMEVVDLETDDVGTPDVTPDIVMNDLTAAGTLYDGAMSYALSVEDVCSAEVL